MQISGIKYNNIYIGLKYYWNRKERAVLTTHHLDLNLIYYYIVYYHPPRAHAKKETDQVINKRVLVYGMKNDRLIPLIQCLEGWKWYPVLSSFLVARGEINCCSLKTWWDAWTPLLLLLNKATQHIYTTAKAQLITLLEMEYSIGLWHCRFIREKEKKKRKNRRRKKVCSEMKIVGRKWTYL